MTVFELHTAASFHMLQGINNSIVWILNEKNEILLQVYLLSHGKNYFHLKDIPNFSTYKHLIKNQFQDHLSNYHQTTVKTDINHFSCIN